MGGSNKQTTTQTSAPYKASQPLLDRAMGDANSLYGSGGLVKPNTQSTVVPYARQTTQAMGGLEALGTANTGGRGLSGQLQGIINQGGYNSDQRTALDGIRDTATGSFDLSANPAFQQILARSQGDAINAANQGAAGMGRYGSGTHNGVVAREVGDLTARMTGAEYNNWQGRKDAAQSALFNAGQTAQGNLGDAYQGMQDAFNPLLQVGAMNEDLYGRQLNDQLRIADERANAPLKNLQALLGVASGTGQYGTGTTTAQGPSNTMSNLLGGGIAGASILNSTRNSSGGKL